MILLKPRNNLDKLLFKKTEGVSMQRLSATTTIMPKGRIISSYTVDHQTVFMLIMEIQVSKLTGRITWVAHHSVLISEVTQII